MQPLQMLKKNAFALYKRIDFLTLSFLRASASKQIEINETYPDIDRYYPVSINQTIKWKIGHNQLSKTLQYFDFIDRAVTKIEMNRLNVKQKKVTIEKIIRGALSGQVDCQLRYIKLRGQFQQYVDEVAEKIIPVFLEKRINEERQRKTKEFMKMQKNESFFKELRDLIGDKRSQQQKIIDLLKKNTSKEETIELLSVPEEVKKIKTQHLFLRCQMQNKIRWILGFLYLKAQGKIREIRSEEEKEKFIDKIFLPTKVFKFSQNQIDEISSNFGLKSDKQNITWEGDIFHLVNFLSQFKDIDKLARETIISSGMTLTDGQIEWITKQSLIRVLAQPEKCELKTILKERGLQ